MASTDEIWLADFGDAHPDEPASKRPALVLGPPRFFGPSTPFVLLAPLTTARRRIKLHVEVEPDSTNGLERTSYVQCEQLRSVSRRRLIHRLGIVDPATSRRVAHVVRTLLGY